MMCSPQTRILTGITLSALACLPTGCRKSKEPVRVRVAPPVAVESDQPTAAFAHQVVWEVSQLGVGQFLIDAPLEKTKGAASRFRGELYLSPTDLTATRGEVDVDLDTIKTTTFDNPEKNIQQTEHSHNWLELGKNVDPKQYAEDRWARFVIRNVKDPSFNDITLAAQRGGSAVVELTAVGELWLNGITVNKSARLQVQFTGNTSAPTGATIKSLQPLTLSMKEHDIKPRDMTGEFLRGALEQIGQKIDDKVQISIELSISPKRL